MLSNESFQGKGSNRREKRITTSSCVLIYDNLPLNMCVRERVYVSTDVYCMCLSKARRRTAETVCENEIMQNIIKTFIFHIQIYLKLNMRNNDEDVTAYESLIPSRSSATYFVCVCFSFLFSPDNSSRVRGLRSYKRDPKISSLNLMNDFRCFLSCPLEGNIDCIKKKL